MIPIKIRCGCGQKYAFDVEPVEGAMGYAVLCPVCGVDGTALANEVIAERLGARPPSAPALRLGREVLSRATLPPMPPNVPSFGRTAGKSGPNIRNKRLVWALSGTVLAAVVLTGGIVFARSAGLGKKPMASGAAVPDGLPHTTAELNAWYVEPPSGQNAAIFVGDAIGALHLANVESSAAPLLGRGKLPPLGGGPLSASVKSSVGALIRSNRDALQFFSQASKCDQSRYPVDFNLGVEATFPHLSKMMGASQLLELAAVLHADASDAKSSIEDLRSAFALANSLGPEPYLSSQSVRARLVVVALAGLEQSANRVCWTPEASAGLFKDLARMEDFDARGEGFTRGVVAERVLTMSLLANPAKFLELLPMLAGDVSAERRQRMMARLQSGKLQAEERFFDQTWGNLIQLRRQPFPERLKGDEMIRQQIAVAAREQLVLAEFLLSGLKIAAREARCVACLRLGLTATALEQFRAAHANRYPASLAELTPGLLGTVPTDPFDGQPLRYQTKSDGYELYSVGPEIKDDLGRSLNGKQEHIKFELVIPPKAKKD